MKLLLDGEGPAGIDRIMVFADCGLNSHMSLHLYSSNKKMKTKQPKISRPKPLHTFDTIPITLKDFGKSLLDLS